MGLKCGEDALCAGEGLNLQTRLVSSCASSCLQDVQGLVPRGASSFPSIYSVHRWLAWTRSLIFRGQSWLPVPRTVSVQKQCSGTGIDAKLFPECILASHGSRAAQGILLGVLGAGRACSRRDIFL